MTTREPQLQKHQLSQEAFATCYRHLTDRNAPLVAYPLDVTPAAADRPFYLNLMLIPALSPALAVRLGFRVTAVLGAVTYAVAGLLIAREQARACTRAEVKGAGRSCSGRSNAAACDLELGSGKRSGGYACPSSATWR
jgi:hypothetical protein